MDYSKFYLILILTITTSCYPSKSIFSVITKVAGQVIENRHRGLARQEFVTKKIKRLAQLLKKVKLPELATRKKLLPLLIDALYYSNCYPQFNNSIHSIDDARSLFSKTDGFQQLAFKLVRNIGNPNHTKGTLFEIATAVELQRYRDHTVRAFSKVIIAGTKKREFDLVTCDQFGTKHFIEVKNVRWRKKVPRATWHQVLDQQKIVRTLNYSSLNNKVYRLISKHELPPSIRKKLNKENISFTECGQ